ncbi:AtpZ/AtpI family protein [Paenibacillus sp. FA6]|uniref:AtpZ/AtpI family protein n=1 Tax=Paenibacillus sp. FA6 TaxID=3413029 RepID=UPI003F65DA55
MDNPKRNDNPWFMALYISGAGGMLATYILIGFFISRWLVGMWEGPRYWIAVGMISGLIVGTSHIVILVKKLLGEQHG